MRYYLLLVLIPASTFAFASLAAATIAASVWPLIDHRTRGSAAGVRARAIAVLRLAPVVLGAMSALVLAGAFVRFEPAHTMEMPGLLLCAGGGILLASSLSAAVRIARAARASATCSRLLRLGGQPMVGREGTRIWVLDSPYPVAAVIGIFRTRLLLSTRLTRECTETELDAIVKHERAHVRRRDNVVRAAMLYLPDPLLAFAAARQMETAWATAAEEAADDAAAGDDCEPRTALASALVRVAKMATTPMPDWVSGLAFYEGQNLENRVRRLLEAGGASTARGRATPASIAGVLIGCALLMTAPAGQQLHAWMEAALRVLP
jgi:Zn-dependent protease with chaperone function